MSLVFMVVIQQLTVRILWIKNAMSGDEIQNANEQPTTSAETLRDPLRGSDIIARCVNEEFCT